MSGNSTKEDMAVELMKSGSTCAQAVISVFAEETGIEKGLAHKIMTGFGGGMGRKQYTCGTITAGVAVLNLWYGNVDPADAEAKNLTYSKVNQFITAMEKKFGHSDCRNLLGVDFTNPDESTRVKDEGLTEKVCHNVLREVVRYLEREI